MMKAFFPTVFAANAMIALHVVVSLLHNNGAITAFGG